MKAAILCPGASVREFTGGFDVIIGVNRAVGFAKCDYWVFIDKYTYVLSKESDSPCVGLPTICLDKGVFRQVCIERPDAKDHPWIDSEPPKGISAKWGLFSATRALVLAHRLGAVEVVAYGVDWDASHPQDWDGYHDHRQVRTERRFTGGEDRHDAQKPRWESVCEQLAERGVVVRRCQEVACA